MNEQIKMIAHLIAIPCSERIEYDGICVDGKECGECHTCTEAAKYIYNAVYRKTEDIAREIFSEIERKLIFIRDADTDNIRGVVTIKDITSIKKKYESEGAE